MKKSFTSQSTLILVLKIEKNDHFLNDIILNYHISIIFQFGLKKKILQTVYKIFYLPQERFPHYAQVK